MGMVVKGRHPLEIYPWMEIINTDPVWILKDVQKSLVDDQAAEDDGDLASSDEDKEQVVEDLPSQNPV